MINQHEIITMKVPYPDDKSALLKKAHMYYCYEKNVKQKKFLKVQTFKPLHLTKSFYITDSIPLKHKSSIDMNKIFYSSNYIFNKKLCTDPKSFENRQVETEIDGLICNNKMNKINLEDYKLDEHNELITNKNK